MSYYLLPPSLRPTEGLLNDRQHKTERAKVRNAMEQTLSATVMKLVTCVNAHKDHIPPITTSEANPFPYQIHVNNPGGVGVGVGGTDGVAAPPGAGWTSRMGIY